MGQYHIRHVPIRTWFPPDDPIATSVARLCILREDLYLETLALIQDNLFPLDDNAVIWRLMYFWRNSVRTLFEIRGAIETLYTERGFRTSLSEQPKALQDAFHKLREQISTSHDVLKHIRNSIGGHVLYNSVKKALSDTAFDQIGMIQLGECVNDTHYRFVSELTIQMWLAEKPIPGRQAEIEQTLKLTAELTRALEAIDIVFETYINSHKLLQ